MSGYLILGVLIAATLFVVLRGPGRRLLLGGPAEWRAPSKGGPDMSDTSTIGGPFSQTEPGGFAGARPRSNAP